MLLESYLIIRLIKWASLVGAAFFSLFLAIGMFDYAGGSLTFGQSLPIVLVDALRLASSFSVSILFFAFLVAFRGLVFKSEIIAMQALGVSLQRLAAMLVVAGLVLSLLWGLVSEGLLPLSSKFDQHYRAGLNRYSEFQTSGKWFRSGRIFLHSEQSIGGYLKQARLLQFDEQNRLSMAADAEQAHWHKGGIILYQVKLKKYLYERDNEDRSQTTKFAPAWLTGARVELQQLDEMKLALDFNQQVFNYFNATSDSLFLWQLWDYIDFLANNNQLEGEAKTIIYEFWQRLLVPVQLIGLMLLFLPSLLSSVRVSSLNKVWLAGVGLGLLVYLVNSLLRSMSVWLEAPAWLLAMVLPVLLFVLGLLCCWRRA